MKTPLEVLHKYFHHFKSERTRDLVVKSMEDYAKIYHNSEVKKLNIPVVMQRSEQLIDFFKWLNAYEKLEYTEKGISFYVEEYLKSINCA
jgi:hypothetical protein